MEATVHSLEAEWSAHEEAMKRTIEGLRTELAAKKAEAEGARQENIKIRAALTEQAQAMAQEAADAATKAQEGNAAAERARREAEEARDALERGGVGGSGGAEAARLRAEALEREEKRRASRRRWWRSVRTAPRGWRRGAPSCSRARSSGLD